MHIILGVSIAATTLFASLFVISRIQLKNELNKELELLERQLAMYEELEQALNKNIEQKRFQ